VESGRYSVEIYELKKGKYKGVIYIEGQAKSIIADSLHIVTLSVTNADAFDFTIKTDKFKRALPFYFQKV
jgi:hypothetical protein